VLSEALPGLVGGLRFGKTMRWNSSGVAFSRPIRWFVSLLGDRVVPLQYAGLGAAQTSRGSRPAGSPVLQVADAGSYLPLMAQQAIIVDRDARRAEISHQTPCWPRRSAAPCPSIGAC
jgi:glycyl-tRNA synthetase